MFMYIQNKTFGSYADFVFWVYLEDVYMYNQSAYTFTSIYMQIYIDYLCDKYIHHLILYLKNNYFLLKTVNPV